MKFGDGLGRWALRSLAECALDFRDADVDPFSYICVQGFRLAPDSQRIEFILQNRAELAQVLICIASANDKLRCGLAIVIAVVLQHLCDSDVVRCGDSDVFALSREASDYRVRNG